MPTVQARLQALIRYDFEDDELPADEPRSGVTRLNRPVSRGKPKLRKRGKVDRSLLEPGMECRRCRFPEAGVKSFDSAPGFYRLHWECAYCGCRWSEEKH